MIDSAGVIGAGNGADQANFAGEDVGLFEAAVAACLVQLCASAGVCQDS